MHDTAIAVAIEVHRICQGRPLWLLAPGATDDTSGVQSERGHSPQCMCQLAHLFHVLVALPSILHMQLCFATEYMSQHDDRKQSL
jgi:hypothetical protein